MKIIPTHHPLESPWTYWLDFSSVCTVSCQPKGPLFLFFIPLAQIFWSDSFLAGVSGPVHPIRAVFPQLPRHPQLLLLRWRLCLFPWPVTRWALPPQVPAHQWQCQNMSLYPPTQPPQFGTVLFFPLIKTLIAKATPSPLLTSSPILSPLWLQMD